MLVMLYMGSLWKGVVARGSVFRPLEIYIKSATYPHRFFHPEPAAAPVTDTDIGPLLSAPRSRTDSWPCHKCEHLKDTRESQHIINT